MVKKRSIHKIERDSSAESDPIRCVKDDNLTNGLLYHPLQMTYVFWKYQITVRKRPTSHLTLFIPLIYLTMPRYTTKINAATHIKHICLIIVGYTSDMLESLKIEI